MSKVLNTNQLISLYKKGFFPMAENATSKEIKYYKPEKRFILPIKKFHIPRKLFTEFKKNKYEFKINSQFADVVKNCSLPRKINSGTWINKIILDTYIELHIKGYAKSIECFDNNKLIGGLYGIHIGGCFFGESMFSKIKNTSKLCLLFLISILNNQNFNLLDSQYYNKHLLQFGAFEIKDSIYQTILHKEINKLSIFPNIFDFQKSLSILHSISHKS